MSQASLNKLLKLCIPIFDCYSIFSSSYIIQDGENDDHIQNGDIDSVKQLMLDAFDKFEREAMHGQFALADVQEAKYALAAYIDELVMKSNWPGRSSWMSQTLQLHYFGEHLAGEGFFKRLERIQQQSRDNADLLEVYYTCLQFGFEGKYRIQGLEKLTAMQVDLRSQIDGIRGRIDAGLSSDAIPKNNVMQTISREIPFWVIGSAALALIFIIYMIYSLLIGHQASNLLFEVNQHYHDLVYTNASNAYLYK